MEILNSRQKVVKAAFEAIADEAHQLGILGVDAQQQRVAAEGLRSFYSTIVPAMGKTSHEALVYAYRRATDSLDRLDRITAMRLERHP